LAALVSPMSRPRSALTSRQRAVVALLDSGLTCPKIALRLGIKERTVRRHIEDIASKLSGDQPPIRRILAHAKELLEAA
jgi:DNA-binding NarL/FixJ family response regulator